MPLEEGEVDGRAFGADLVGGFDHHTGLWPHDIMIDKVLLFSFSGEFGPFGFYANYYDQK